MTRKFVIGDKVVTQESVGYVIAEIGHNHQGNMDTCKAMFRAAVAQHDPSVPSPGLGL